MPSVMPVASSETQGFNGEGGGKKNECEKNEEKEGEGEEEGEGKPWESFPFPTPPPSSSSFSPLPVPSPLKPWVSEDVPVIFQHNLAKSTVCRKQSQSLVLVRQV